MAFDEHLGNKSKNNKSMKVEIIEDTEILSKLRSNSEYEWFVQKFNRDSGRFELVGFDKTKEMMLSWYGPSNYVIKHKDGEHEYWYQLSDQNDVNVRLGIGEAVFYPKIPKSLPIVVRYEWEDIYKEVDENYLK